MAITSTSNEPSWYDEIRAQIPDVFNLAGDRKRSEKLLAAVYNLVAKEHDFVNSPFGKMTYRKAHDRAEKSIGDLEAMDEFLQNTTATKVMGEETPPHDAEAAEAIKLLTAKFQDRLNRTPRQYGSVKYSDWVSGTFYERIADSCAGIMSEGQLGNVTGSVNGRLSQITVLVCQLVTGKEHTADGVNRAVRLAAQAADRKNSTG